MVSLWRDTVRKEPENARAHCSLAVGLMGTQGGLEEAVTELEAALALEPRYPLAENELGLALKSLPGRTKDAVQHLREAIRLDPGYALAHYNLRAHSRGSRQRACGRWRVRGCGQVRSH